LRWKFYVRPKKEALKEKGMNVMMMKESIPRQKMLATNDAATNGGYISIKENGKQYYNNNYPKSCM
jgi:hypothetical protein